MDISLSNVVACRHQAKSRVEIPFSENSDTRPTRGAHRCAPRAMHTLLLVVDFFYFSVDDVIVMRLALLGACGTRSAGLGLHIGVHLLAELLARGAQRFDLGIDICLVRTAQCAFQCRDGRFDRFLLRGLDLVAVLGQRLAGAVHQRVALVTGIGQFASLLVFFGVQLGILHHLLDLGIRQARVRLDDDLVFLARGLVLRAHVQNAVGVDVEGHFDLRRATCGGRNAFEVELAQRLVAGSHFALTLIHLDRHSRLVVVRRREHLRVLRRDRGVLRDHLRHHAAQRFDTERERGHVEQQHILTVAREHRTLNRGTCGHGFVRVHVLARLLAEELLDLVLHLRHTGHTADQNHVVDVAHLHTGILDSQTAGLDRAFDQLFDQRFELGARDLQVQVLRTRGIGRDVRQIDFGLLARRQFDLGLFRRFLQALQRKHVLRQIDALFLLELADDVVDDALVEVFTAQERVAVGRQHFELVLAVHIRDFDDRDVERAATQVIHGDLAVAAFFLVQTESQCGCGRLIDDALDFQTGDAPGVLGCLTLAVVEVGRHRDHRFRHRFAQIILGGLLHLAQHFSGNLRRGQLLVARFHPGVAVVGLDDLVRHQADVLLHFFFFEAAADQALDSVQRVLRVGHRLTLGRRADQDLAIVHVRDDRRRGAGTFRVFDDLDLIAFHDGHARVGGAQVNTDNFAHLNFS
ncbi:NAD-specific glutamate dehydrogenase [Pandoraea sp. SD6-2]|nr:NAD-specific glutamate dehydrogenase [Pandoraea sp. SD6-2]